MIHIILAYLKWICGVLIIGGLLYILWRRSRNQYVTLQEIISWANQYKDKGKNVYISKLSVMPAEIRKQVQHEIGGKRILNGYKDDTSIFATVVDTDKQVITSWYFLGNKLDNDLTIALGDKTGINIEI